MSENQGDNSFNTSVATGENSESFTGNKRRNHHGVVYQILVLILCFFRIHPKKLIYEFEFEKIGSGNLDDIILRYKVKEEDEWSTIFIQAKHKQTEGINNFYTGGTLLSKSNGEKMSIHKYLESFVKLCAKNPKEMINAVS